MQTVLWLNEFLNRHAPALKKVIRAAMPHALQTKFAERKFTLTVEDENYTKTFANIHLKNWWGSDTDRSSIER